MCNTILTIVGSVIIIIFIINAVLYSDGAEADYSQEQESQEVLEEQVLRQLTRDYIDFLGELAAVL